LGLHGVDSFFVVLRIWGKAYLGCNRCKQPVLMMPRKANWEIFLDDLVKGDLWKIFLDDFVKGDPRRIRQIIARLHFSNS